MGLEQLVLYFLKFYVIIGTGLGGMGTLMNGARRIGVVRGCAVLPYKRIMGVVIAAGTRVGSKTTTC